DFANRLFGKWGVGPKGKDRGVMILLAVDDHKYWIEVGYGLEPILPDGKVGGYGREIVPLLRQNQYGPAVLQAPTRVAVVIGQERSVNLDQGDLPASSQSTDSDARSFFGIPDRLLLPVVFLALFVGFPLLRWLLAVLGIISYTQRRGPRGRGWIGPMG